VADLKRSAKSKAYFSTMGQVFEEHPAAAITCLLSGVLGVALLFAFIAPFDPERFGVADYKRMWKDLVGVRFILPLGIALCAISGGIYLIWLK
jgi:hypothetical protein